jgi:hypothetical protein
LDGHQHKKRRKILSWRHIALKSYRHAHLRRIRIKLINFRMMKLLNTSLLKRVIVIGALFVSPNLFRIFSGAAVIASAVIASAVIASAVDASEAEDLAGSGGADSRLVLELASNIFVKIGTETRLKKHNEKSIKTNRRR